MSTEAILLLDNGSLEPAAVLGLRRIARALGERTGLRVEPVSVRHSKMIPPAELEGVPAETIEGALAARAAAGVRRFKLVPMFFGPSGALTNFLPFVVKRVGEKHPDLEVGICPLLHQAGDSRLAQILAANIEAVARSLPAVDEPRPVALVDHGSPVREVTAVRDALAAEVAAILGDACNVAACSMERSDGAEFDFNEPLLEALLTKKPWNEGDVIVAMQFLQPGRHAGPGGDVAAISRAAEHRSPGLRTHMTALVGESPELVGILADRLAAGAAAL